MTRASDQLDRKSYMTRILYVIGSLDLGGTERHVALIAPALRARGFEPIIFCLSRRGVQANPLSEQGVAIIGPPFEGRPGDLRALRALMLIASSIKLFFVMRRIRPDIAHFFLPMAYLIGAPLARLAGVPVRIMSRRSRNLYQAKHPLLSLMEWRLHRSMQAVIGNSRAVTADLAAEGCGADQIHLIYNGIDVAAIDSAEARPRPADAALIFVIVANLIPYKGHADLLRALAANARTLPPGWRLHCIGRDDGSGVQLGRLAAALGIKENVEFLGARTDVAARIKTADIGILCSHEEGFSNAILECMAAGLPMVVTDVGGNAEAVIDGETGIVVAPSDIPALGTALRDLASAPEKRSRLGRKGRERVQDFYSLDRCISDYEALYFSFAGHKSMNGADGLPTLPTGTQ